jgi:PAS domain S-box-containing protein
MSKSATPIIAAPVSRLGQSRRGLIAIGIVATAMLALGLGTHLWMDYRVRVVSAQTSAEKLTISLEEHTRAVFETVDAVLSSTAGQLMRAAQRGETDDAAIRAILLRNAVGHRPIHSMSLRDRDGLITQLTLLDQAPRTDNSKSDYFQVQAESSTVGSYIGRPIRSQVTGEWMLPISRRLEEANGRFTGVLVAAVPVRFFEEFFRSLQVGRHGLVTLFRTDGVHLVREPTDDLIGKVVPGSALFVDYLPSAPVGAFTTKAATDGIERFFAYRAVASLPLVVIAGISVDDAMAPWYANLWLYLATWILCAAVISIFIAILLRQARLGEASEKAAREAENKFANLVANAPGIVFQRVRRPDGKFEFTFVSAKHEELTGYPGEELIRNPAIAPRIVHEDDRGPYRDAVERSGAMLTPLTAEMRIRRPDGEVRWMRTMSIPRRTADGTILWDGVMVDVTDRKHMELALQKSEAEASQARAMLTDAIESLNGGFVLYDANDRLVLMNRAAREWDPGFAAIAVPGITHDEIIRAVAKTGRIVGNSDSVEEIIRERIDRHRKAYGQPVERKVGERWYQITEHPTSDGGVVVLRTEITAVKQAGLEAARAQLLAEEANRAKSEFLAMMSHELRTPLNAILGFSELLRDQGGRLTAAKAAEYAGDVHSSGTLLLNLINDVLDLSKAEAGKMELHCETVNAAESVTRALRMVRERAGHQGVRLVTEIAPSLPPLFADDRKLLQILLNLLSNAIKFTPAGGRVTIAATHADDMLSIRITDTGIGIAAKDIERALAAFGQVHTLFTREHSGTGLGLPLAKRLTELHGGRFHLQSEPGAGTTVTLQFPIVRDTSRPTLPLAATG